ncbi:hypothetical protein GA0115260_1028956 [Streptomyces sp. MnatMP-M27]|nr:hypothetical protein GA0115260_1028956 [Streptomyces sp. MnatMP-M27]
MELVSARTVHGNRKRTPVTLGMPIISGEKR